VEWSLKLHPLDEAKALQQVCKFNLNNRGGQGQPRQRTNVWQAAPEEPKDVRKFTSEDEDIVKSISSKKDYYEILDIYKTADENEIKKAYRKLALKLHPDKNPHPKATDAFKKVSAAFACLSDKEKRNVYD